MKSLLPFLCLALLLAAACGDDKKRPATDAGSDAGSDAASDADTDANVDAGPPDLSGDPANDACLYIDTDVYITDCKSGDLYARRWVAYASTADAGTDDAGTAADAGADAGAEVPFPECPDYFTLEGKAYFSLADALTSWSCESECARTASTSVSLIRCGVRNGYIIYKDPENDCPDVYETADGNFPSIEAWNEAFPCPEEP